MMMMHAYVPTYVPDPAKPGAARFHCSALRTDLRVAECLDRFVDANALSRRDSPCFKCKQGQKNRECFAAS